MSDTDVLLLNLEVEAAAARNADLSRQLERLTDELACSTVHRVERADDVSRGTQTEFDISRDVALDLDDLLFEMAEVMFRLYPTTPLDLSNRRDDSSRRVEELSQRCLREMRSLKIAWETKLEGYNKFIEDLQKGLGEYYRSLEEVQCQLRNKEAQCNTLTRDNAELSEHCAELEERLRLVQEAAGNAGEDVTQLMRQVTDLETERQRLLDRETVLLNTVASLRAECALGPWKNTGFVKERTSFVQPSSHSQVPVRHGASQENDTRGRTGRDASVGDVMFACQGSAVNRAFPEWQQAGRMEAGTDSQVQWSNLLEAGDAATLFAIFRETVSSALPGSSETKSILQFMESHLYVAALKVDLEALCTTTSMGFLESVLNETRPSRLDPRECLTELLSATWLGDGYGVAVYLRLLQATFRQIFFDTLRRRKECTTVVERRLKARTTMRAWYGGVDSRVSQIILRLCKRDALPKMVQTVKRFQTDGCGSDDDEEQDDNSTDTLPLVEPTTLEALLQLVLDLSTVVGDSRRTVPLLLMVKAVTVAAQSYSDDDEFLHKNGNEWQKWAATLCRVGDMKTGTSTPTHDMEYSPALASRGNFRETGERATRALLDMIPACGLVAFLLECSDGRFGKDIMDSVAYEDNERGRDASSTKVLARIQALKKEEDELCVLSDGDWVSEEDEHYVGHFSLRMVGAMLLLCDLMMQDCCECRSLLSNSPSVLFFLLGPMLLESLKSSSLSVAMTGLALLAVVLPHVPPYSIHAYGELNEESTQAQGLEEDAPSLDSCSYHTRKFGLVFELVKSLMNISATCPSEAHRVVARAVFTLFLRRCAGDLRMVVYSSFLVVTPFASICSLMLHSLREEWNSCQSLCNPSEYRFLRRTLPRCLLRTQENWMKRLLTGETGFIDPLVQSLNFVRSLIAEDYRRQPKDALFQFASGDPRAQLRKETGKGESCDRWDTYLSRLMRDVVPQLRALVVAAEAAVSSSTVEEKGAKEPLGALRTATLSPLDCFALTMALEGLEGQVVCGG